MRTKTYRAKFEEVDLLCTACKTETETTEHIVLRCTKLRPALTEGTEVDIEGRLDFLGKAGKEIRKALQ